MVKAFHHLDHVVVGSNTPKVVMETCAVSDFNRVARLFILGLELSGGSSVRKEFQKKQGFW